jgi:Icc-related predicted phosphoesterase
VIRVGAVGDVHAGVDSGGTLRPRWDRLPDEADCLLLAGDLTKGGEVDEAAVLAGELDGLGLPVIAVLGNHDHHAGNPGAVRDVLTDAGITVLEGDASLIEVGGMTLGVVGAKGFGGGFEGAMATEFGEEEMKAFVRHTRERADAIDRALRDLEADLRIVLLHYAPVRDTLLGEPAEIYPFLGSYLLAEPCDRAGIDLIVHGHAHRGHHEGTTSGGVPVRNVAMPVIESAYVVFSFDLDPGDRTAGDDSQVPVGTGGHRADHLEP